MTWRNGKGGRPKYGSSTLVPETSTVRPPWQHKTEEKEGCGEDAEVKADTRDIRVEVMKGGYRQTMEDRIEPRLGPNVGRTN